MNHVTSFLGGVFLRGTPIAITSKQKSPIMQTQEYVLIFHSKQEEGWVPGAFRPHMFMSVTAAQELNRGFTESGVLVIPASIQSSKRHRAKPAKM